MLTSHLIRIMAEICVHCHHPHSQYPDPDQAGLLEGLQKLTQEIICSAYSTRDTSDEASTQNAQQEPRSDAPESQPTLESSVPEDSMAPFAKNGTDEHWFGPPISFSSFDGRMGQFCVTGHHERKPNKAMVAEAEAEAARRQRKILELSDLEIAREQYVRKLEYRPAKKLDPMRTTRKQSQIDQWKKRNKLRSQLGNFPARRAQLERSEKQRRIRKRKKSEAKHTKTPPCDDEAMRGLLRKHISRLAGFDRDVLTDLQIQPKEIVNDVGEIKSKVGGINRISVVTDPSKSLWSRIKETIRERWAGLRSAKQKVESPYSKGGKRKRKRERKEYCQEVSEKKRQRMEHDPKYTWSRVYQKSNLARETKLDVACGCSCSGKRGLHYHVDEGCGFPGDDWMNNVAAETAECYLKKTCNTCHGPCDLLYRYKQVVFCSGVMELKPRFDFELEC